MRTLIIYKVNLDSFLSAVITFNEEKKDQSNAIFFAPERHYQELSQYDKIYMLGCSLPVSEIDSVSDKIIYIDNNREAINTYKSSILCLKGKFGTDPEKSVATLTSEWFKVKYSLVEIACYSPIIIQYFYSPYLHISPSNNFWEQEIQKPTKLPE